MTVKPYTKTVSWEYFFGPITGRRNPKLSIQNSTWQKLAEDIWFNGYEYAAGSEYKRWETDNFGFVVFKPGTLSPNGQAPYRLIHKY